MKRKLLLVGLLALCLLVSNVSALLPHPIHGTITNDGSKLSNIEMTYSRQDSQFGLISKSLTTRGDGSYLFDLGNIDDRFSVGDTVTIKINYCSGSSACVRTFQLTGGGENFDIDVASVSTSIVYKCSDGSEVSDLDDCPEVIVDDPITCGDCVCTSTQCEDVVCEEPEPCTPEACDDICSDEEYSFPWLEAMISIIGAAGIASGVTYYVRKDYNTVKGVTVKTRLDLNGNEVVTHHHRGLRTFHDPKVSHTREPWEKHPRGCLYPKYERNPDNGNRYEFVPVK